MLKRQLKLCARVFVCLSGLLILLSAVQVNAQANYRGQAEPPVEEQVIVPEPRSLEAPSACAYSDDFSDPSSGWWKYQDIHEWERYDGGKYKVTLYGPGGSSRIWFGKGGTTCPEIRVSLDATVAVDNPTGNPVNYYGITFGSSGTTLYGLYIYTDGYFRLEKKAGAVYTDLIPRTYSSWINPGLAGNHLMVDAGVDGITVVVNGHVLGTASDPSYAGGDQGLSIARFSGTNVFEVVFDNFVQTESLHHFIYLPLVDK
jgi:hypothetical protein